MEPVTLGAIISGGAALASGGASIAANANLNKKNRQWQAKMVREQRQREDEVYASRYSPSAQAQAMASAGINPFNGVQTMNVGTSSSVPTPASTPLDFSSIGQAGQAIASGLHAREAMKLQREQFAQSVTNDTRNYILELQKLNLSEQELNVMLESKKEEIRGMSLDNDTKELNYKMLEEFYDSGGNTYSDASSKVNAEISKIFSDIADGQRLTDAQISAIEENNETNRLQRRLLRHTLKMSEKFDEKFYDLDLQEREQRVKEFMDTAEYRENFAKWSNDINEWIHRNAEQNSILNDLSNQYQRDIWKEITENLDGNKLDAVLIKWLTTSPADLFKVLSMMKPDITIDNSTKHVSIANQK